MSKVIEIKQYVSSNASTESIEEHKMHSLSRRGLRDPHNCLPSAASVQT